MKFFADLHTHSRFSMATQKRQGLADLFFWAAMKGIGLIATGDATHPAWLDELESGLEEAEDGLYALKKALWPPMLPHGPATNVRFALQSEVSAVYKDRGKTRRVHLLFYFPTLVSAKRFSRALSGYANIVSDGRPITGLNARTLFGLFLDNAPDGFMIPAHVMTPWYSLLGARSGYDSPEECFGDMTGLLPAVETGLSADPEMLRRIPSLDRFGLVSFSDAHSPAVIGREASEFDLDLSFGAIFEAMRPGDPRFLSTIEFFPELGKYHFSGHRKCDVVLKGSAKTCPVCGRPLTEGVSARVETLSGRLTGIPDRPYVKLIGLRGVLSSLTGRSPSSKTVGKTCRDLIYALGPELYILRDASYSDIESSAGPLLSKAIRSMRMGSMKLAPGHDGAYGSFVFDSLQVEEPRVWPS